MSAVIRRLPSTTSLRRFAEIPSRSAAVACRRPSGLRNSSINISPGGMAGPDQSGSLVRILDSDFAGMAVLPAKREAILVVDPFAVPTGTGALQRLRVVSGGNSQIVEPGHHVEGLQLALRDAPHVSRQAARVTRVAFAEQIHGGLIGERRNHAPDKPRVAGPILRASSHRARAIMCESEKGTGGPRGWMPVPLDEGGAPRDGQDCGRGDIS